MNADDVRRMLEPYPEESRHDMLIKLFIDQHSWLTNERTKKAAPERKEFEELREELEYARSGRERWQEHTEHWKKVCLRLGNEIEELKQGTRIPHLEAEVEQWKHLWRNSTRRLGNAIEHLGFEHTGAEPTMDQE